MFESAFCKGSSQALSTDDIHFSTSRMLFMEGVRQSLTGVNDLVRPDVHAETGYLIHILANGQGSVIGRKDGFQSQVFDLPEHMGKVTDGCIGSP
jgi:hypothetical protein